QLNVTALCSLTDHLLSDHLLCSICVAIFIDPVSLKCQHTFCRQCLKDSLKAGNRHCPVCLDPIKQSRFKVNRILRDIMQELRSGIESGISEIEGARSEGSEVCPEHNQPLKLWCKKDKQLLCLVCRDSRVHQGHRFQPLDEAREDIQKRVASVLGVLRGDISKVEKLTQRHLRHCSGVMRAHVSLIVAFSSSALSGTSHLPLHNTP
uniref:Uncharacterized protein n=1 Tax=Esox lucius TaxID=8010 RepID=A0A3P8XTH9_ESOLU